MSLKRKATSASSGQNPAKRAVSRNMTPAGSDEEWTEGGDSNLSDAEDIQKLIDRYNPLNRIGKTKIHDAASHMFKFDQNHVQLKADHYDRPLWIDAAGRIILESFSSQFRSAQNFLIQIAEPQSRVSRMHEYTLTAHSLFAAVSIGLTTEDILDGLNARSKVELPDELVRFISEATGSFGKARLVLKNTKYFIESSDPKILQALLRDPTIGACRVDSAESITTSAAPKMGAMAIPGTKLAAGVSQVAQAAQATPVQQADEMLAVLREDDGDEDVDEVHSFQIAAPKLETVSKRCRAIGLPLTEEYDFTRDERNANLDIDLRPAARIRDYQEQALYKMFGNGRARSGIIVLPCGAGKTLVGITAACTVKKSAMVLCTSAMSVVQWRAEFLKWSNINPADIACFTADNKDKFPGNAGILISTYSMMSRGEGKRSLETGEIMDWIKSREWGLLVADEVHVVPAGMFKRVTWDLGFHSKLGLTATLLREDDKIEDLNFLIGPKLYEANWQELSEQGHIAKVQCAEVWCPMTTEFYTEYLKATSTNKRALLFTMNPRKFQACQFLIDYHESRGDKIIVFSDNVYALEAYARKLKKAYIYGGTPQAERLRILENFQHNELVNTIFLSKIGDTSLDLPEATCLIQISSHYGSRRQEAQRLGRILRAKRRNDEGFNAFFYSLVSKDTNEMYYSSKRQAFLVDQGYAFKVITHLQGIDQLPGLAFTTPQERRELLQDVLLQNETAGEMERIDGDMFSVFGGKAGKRKGPAGARRTAGTLSEFSGGRDMAYIEYNRSANKDLKGKGTRNDFLKKLKRQTENQRKVNKGP